MRVKNCEKDTKDAGNEKWAEKRKSCLPSCSSGVILLMSVTVPVNCFIAGPRYLDPEFVESVLRPSLLPPQTSLRSSVKKTKGKDVRHRCANLGYSSRVFVNLSTSCKYRQIYDGFLNWFKTCFKLLRMFDFNPICILSWKFLTLARYAGKNDFPLATIILFSGDFPWVS